MQSSGAITRWNLWAKNAGTLLVSALVLAAFLLGLASTVAAQDFRVDTEVFVGEEEEPIVETLTIFADGLVYDFLLGKQQETTIFDPHRGEFTLLDLDRQVKATVSTQDVLDYTFALEQHASQSSDAVFAAAASPNFQVTFESLEEKGVNVGKVVLTSKAIVYEVRGQVPQQPDSVRFYRHFADWYARLNSTRPGNLPPGSRLALNKALADHELLPSEVTRTITPSGRFSKQLVHRSRHFVNWKLSGEDRRQITKAGDQMAKFKLVSFDDYRGMPPVAAEGAPVRGASAASGVTGPVSR